MKPKAPRETIKSARNLYKKGKVLEAKALLVQAMDDLEASPDINPKDWRDLVEAANEVMAIQLIWVSYQVAKNKTISFAETLAKINGNPYRVKLAT